MSSNHAASLLPFVLLTALAIFVAGCGEDLMPPTPVPMDSSAPFDSGALDSGAADSASDDSGGADAGDATVTCVDTDADGVCDDLDACEGYDDAVDTDGDGTADGCDCDSLTSCAADATCAEYETGAACECNAGYSGDGMSCDPVDCGALTDPADGNVTAAATTFESAATYACDAGFTLTGDMTRSCQADGSWSGAEPTCDIVSCPVLTRPANGTVVATAATYMAVATYSCVAGYTLSGDMTRTCQADGVWSGAEPTCALGCPAPRPPADGSVSAATTAIGAYAAYSCDAGYQLRGATHSRCTAARTWLGQTPECAAILACAGAACAGYAAGDPIIANVANPGDITGGVPAGSTGFALAGNTSAAFALLTEWTGWTGGHTGSCASASCGPCTEGPLDSRWYLACSTDFQNQRLTCSRGGEFYVGERVVSLVDDPDGAMGVTQGQLGTVVAASTSRPLVEWDGWAGGHNGLCGGVSCGPCTASGNARWYTPPDLVGLAAAP